MPRTIKLFVVLSAIYVVWRLYWTFLLVVHPTPEWASVLASMLPSERRDIQTSMLENAIFQSVLFILPFAVLAGLAAYRRSNWARWGVVAFLLFMEVFPLVTDAWFFAFRPELAQYIKDPIGNWLQTYHFDLAHWGMGVKVALKAALITLLFLPASRPWFRKAGNAA